MVQRCGECAYEQGELRERRGEEGISKEISPYKDCCQDKWMNKHK
jgi:hypothetical protein